MVSNKNTIAPDNIIHLVAFGHAQAMRRQQTPDLRVWDRAKKQYDRVGYGEQSFSNHEAYVDILGGAINSLGQYIENEWPVENGNKVRAAEIAQMAGVLFFRGCFAKETSQSAIDLQDKVFDAFDTPEFQDARHIYSATIANLSAVVNDPQLIG